MLDSYLNTFGTDKVITLIRLLFNKIALIANDKTFIL